MYGLLVFLISCTAKDKGSQTAKNFPDETSIALGDTISAIDTTYTAQEESDDDDCIFNNNYKGLTSEWLKELNITEFIWRDDLKHAVVPKGKDTLFFAKGGCTHSGILVELKLANDSHDLADSIYWIDKALTLSAKYRMDHYEKMIRERKIKKANSGEANVWYEVEDNNAQDNLFFNGIEISQEQTGKRISISQYFN